MHGAKELKTKRMSGVSKKARPVHVLRFFFQHKNQRQKNERQTHATIILRFLFSRQKKKTKKNLDGDENRCHRRRRWFIGRNIVQKQHKCVMLNVRALAHSRHTAHTDEIVELFHIRAIHLSLEKSLEETTWTGLSEH